MAKLLPVLVIICIVAIALTTLNGTYHKYWEPKKVQGTQDQKHVLLIADSNQAVTIDGKIAEARAPDSTLPKLYATTSSQSLEFAANLANDLSASDFQIASLRILDNEALSAYNQQGTVALFSTKKDEKEQINSLQQVMAKSKIDATKIQKIDLRFDKPVVTLK